MHSPEQVIISLTEMMFFYNLFSPLWYYHIFTSQGDKCKLKKKKNVKTISWLNVCPFWHHRMANYGIIWTKRILISLTQETLISVVVEREHGIGA